MKEHAHDWQKDGPDTPEGQPISCFCGARATLVGQQHDAWTGWLPNRDSSTVDWLAAAREYIDELPEPPMGGTVDVLLQMLANENERLSAALQRIADYAAENPMEDVMDAGSIAREALEAGER
jgi:hypothetical protein